MVTIEGSIRTWRASGPSAPRSSIEALSARETYPSNVVVLLVPGRKGLRPSRSMVTIEGSIWTWRASDQDLEGVRSLGAALFDRSFVCSGKRIRPMLWFFVGPRLQETAALQINGDH
jgi:hypothetical protein